MVNYVSDAWSTHPIEATQQCVLLAKDTCLWGESVNRKVLHLGVISYMAVMVGAIILYTVQSNAHQRQAIVDRACSGARRALSKVPIIYCYLCVKLLLVRRTSVTYGQFISFCKQLIQVLGQKSGVKNVHGFMIVKMNR